jgi:hypothetical protein
LILLTEECAAVGQDPCGEPGRWIAVPKTAAI